MLRLLADENFNGRILRGLLRRVPGVFEVDQDMPIGQAIEELVLIVEASLPSEWEGQVRFLPL